MDIRKIQEALSKIPHLEDIEDDESSRKAQDLLSTAEEFTKIVRKLGVQQMRDSQDLLASITNSINDLELTKQSAERERERAVRSERFSKKAVAILIGNIDLFDRIASGMRESKNNEAWAKEIDNSIAYCLRELEKLGIVENAKAGDHFDSNQHNIEGEFDNREDALVVKIVIVRGFSWDGQVVRRALVKL